MLHFKTVDPATLELLKKLMKLPALSEKRLVGGTGKEDIAAMKLSAITGRGSKKDFYDIYFLLKEFSLEQMLQFYLKKYPQGTLFLVLKSLAYFGDADENFEPTLIKPVLWKNVKTAIMSEIDKYYNLNKGT